MNNQYSVAIRTLGKNPDVLCKELESIWGQTIQPKKVIVYIAEGFDRPEICVGAEQYIWVTKGMVAQRALAYEEIDNELLMLLDDDVQLAPDTAERMIRILDEYQADCVGADVFASYNLTWKKKLYAALTNLVLPRFFNDGWADKIRINGALSYTNKCYSAVLPTETVGGPCSLWRKDVLLSLRWQDELWMDHLAQFAYGDDMVETYKLHINGGRLVMDMKTAVKNLNAQTSSDVYRKSADRFYTRSIMTFCNWWRAVFSTQPDSCMKVVAATAFSIRAVWLFFVHIGVCFIMRDYLVIYLYVKGLVDGWSFVHSDKYKSIPSYKL